MKEPQNHIFFLNYNDKLPRAYIHLASRLAVYGVKLVPVSAKDLTALASPNKQFILSIIPDMTSHSKHLAFRRQYLDFALKTRKFRLFEVSTFAEAEDLAQVKRVDGYDHLPLPMQVDALAKHLALAVLTEEFDTKSWPGGRRAKLPTA
tara:strand:+ start:360 stop:806 length:447 start_codon:yes stop_codon:yes gene_type:complete